MDVEHLLLNFFEQPRGDVLRIIELLSLNASALAQHSNTTLAKKKHLEQQQNAVVIGPPDPTVGSRMGAIVGVSIARDSICDSAFSFYRDGVSGRICGTGFDGIR
ncbi:MAG: Clp protease N-terminal domain-containing protein [Acidobacteriaceae bacterium]|nr:Clp protease N-terminal domain-containing protein [Acidobacteriaceae bacterium]